MAPLPGPPESFALPPLDKCFNEGHGLISWKSASEALSNLDLATRSPNLKWFLLDDLSVNALASEFEPFKAPTPQTKSDFETRTAEIHVTPSSNGHLDTKQIKDDALWLSQQTKIDEVLALRIVILEWQSRSATQILQGYSEEEVISLSQAVGTADFGITQSNLRATAFATNTSATPFDAVDSRHARLLRLVLSEQEHILETSTILRVASGLGAPVAPSGRMYGLNKRDSALPWVSDVMEKVSVAGSNGSKQTQTQSSRDFVLDGVKALEKMLAGWEVGSKWSSTLDDPNSFELEFRNSQLRQMVLTLQVIATRIATLESSPSAVSVQSWFEFVDKCGFFELLEARSSDQTRFVGPLQALVSLISLQLLRLPYTIAYLNDQSTLDRPPPIIHDAACRAQVDETMRNAASRKSNIASPAVFAWSMILQILRNRVQYATEDSISDDDLSFSESGSPTAPRQFSVNVPGGFADALDSIVQTSPENDPVAMYARVAADECSVLNVISTLSRVLGTSLAPPWNHLFQLHARLTLLELARQAVYFIDYKAEILECVLAILEGEPNHEGDSSWQVSYAQTELATIFMNDNDILVPRLLHQAYGRYPYEMAPLVKLCKALVRRTAPRINEKPIPQPLCDPTPYFSQQLPKGFNGYELVREDENVNGVKLTQDLPLISRRRSKNGTSVTGDYRHAIAVKNGDEGQGEFYIPNGTTGTVISESKPFVVAWDYMHSPLRYLACLLSTVTASSDRMDIFSNSPLDDDSQADVISIFAKLLDAYHQNSSTNNKVLETSASPAIWVLEEASDILDRNEDIISIIFEIFERELSKHMQQRAEAAVSTLTSCIEFFCAALKVVPGRIWPLLARSELLELSGRGGRIIAVIAAESSWGSCGFLDACLSLFEALRHDVVSQSVSSKVPSAAVATRFSKEDDSSPRLPKKIIGEILLAFAHTFTGVLESVQNWPLKSGELKLTLSASILRVFSHTVLDVYACDDAHEPSKKLGGPLALAAKYILDSFTTTSESGLVASALISNLSPLNPATKQGFAPNVQQSEKSSVGVVLDFLTMLLDVSLLLGTHIQHLEEQLFRTLPLFVRLYSAGETHKSSILLLFSSLVYKAGLSDSKPTSLLGYLGAANAQSFLSELKQLNRSLGDPDLEIRTWDLASAVIKSRQLWFASFLITGETPKNSLRSKDADKTVNNTDKTLLATALESLSKLSALHSPRALAMLRFVLHAQNQWPLATRRINKHPDFLSRLCDYVGSLTTKLSRVEVEETTQTYASSLIADIFAMYLHNMRQLGDVSFLKTLAPRLSFYRENAVNVPTYNSSLHSNLKRNFENKFPGCELTDFKRLVGPANFGRNYCYDLNFAAQVLGYHQVWKGPKDRGFEEELARANSNLSLVESQVLLLGSWKTLCVELCHNLKDDKNLQKQMVNVVNHCLVANMESTLPEAIFEHLLQTRAELALVILQRLVNIRSEVPSIKVLLGTVWDTIRASGQNFEIAFVGNLTTYYRTLLRIMLLSLRPHTYLASHRPPSESSNSASETTREVKDRFVPVLLEIATEVVGKGFRSLCAQVHEDGVEVFPSDFALVTSILQNILSVRGIAEAHVQLTLRLCDTGIQRYAVALFSWSDRLASKDDDPIFGELSISLLRELSNIPPMAEFLATEGILSQIGIAPILGHLSNTSSNSLVPQAPLQRIWSTGVLPLVLNVLVAVGDPIALETTAFLNAFPAQLSRSANSLDSAAAPSKSDPLAGRITLSSAIELHTLSMISRALDKYRESPSAAAAGTYAQELTWDKTGVKEDLESWLQGMRSALRHAIVSSTEREADMQRAKPLGPEKGGADACENRLEEAVVLELKGALSCLSGE